MSSRRQQRIADLVRQNVSSIILREVQDPRIRLVSVSSVSMTPDLKRAHVRISALGSEDERKEVIDALSRAAGFLRRQLATHLRGLRVNPELIFELDRGAEHSQHISDLLEQVNDGSDGT
jgi:ribosome-binding factor A